MIAKLLNYTIKFNFISGCICTTKISVPKERNISFLVDNFLLPDKDIYNIRTLSVNIKFICTSFRNR